MGQPVTKGIGIKSELIDEGFRMTKLRNALIEILVDIRTPFSIDEMRGLLKKQGVVAHKVSLYRELVLFKEIGIIRSVHLYDQILRYEFAADHHHHVVCTGCKKIEDVRLKCDFEKIAFQIAQKSKFMSLTHSLEFFGLCKKCSSASLSR